MPKALCNDIEIEYETFGSRTKPAIVLIMGLGCQLTHWPISFCQSLALAGFYVIRFDNRDVGLSSKVTTDRKYPLGLKQLLDYVLGKHVASPYTLEDMANDTVALMDELNISAGHIVGASLGGMIAQLLTLRHPEKVLSLTSIMSTSGARHVGFPTPKALKTLIGRPKNNTAEAIIEHMVKNWKILQSPGYRRSDAEIRQDVIQAMQRNFYPAGYKRQLLAALNQQNRAAELKKITAPTLVIHGANDALIHISGGKHTAKHIPQSELKIIPGMGHDFPNALLQELAQFISTHTSRTIR